MDCGTVNIEDAANPGGVHLSLRSGLANLRKDRNSVMGVPTSLLGSTPSWHLRQSFRKLSYWRYTGTLSFLALGIKASAVVAA